LPLLVAWFAVAYATRRFVPTWLAGVTLGVAARMIALGHYHWDQLTFLVVALVFVGAVAAFLLKLPNLVKQRTRFDPKN
jgi:hypothetical protein